MVASRVSMQRIGCFALIGVIAASSGCGGEAAPIGGGGRHLALADFSDPMLRSEPLPDTAVVDEALQASGLARWVPPPPLSMDQRILNAFFDIDAKPGIPVVVDSLIGQVNGRPVFAEEVLGPITDQLRAEYERMSWQQFHPLMERLVMQRLQEVVLNELFLAEARSGLTDSQQHGLMAFVKKLEQDLVGQSGGVQRRAEQEVMAEEGRTIKEYLELQREKVLIQTLMNERVVQHATVSWQDVVRAYNARREEFQPAAHIVIGRIRLKTETDLDEIVKVQEALAAHEPFRKVATEAGMADEGVWVDFKMPTAGIGGLEIAEVYKPVLEQLKPNEVSPPFERGTWTMWLTILDHTQAEQRDLYDPQVQRQLQQELYSRAISKAQNEFVTNVLHRGIYDELALMHKRTLSIAATRFPPR